MKSLLVLLFLPLFLMVACSSVESTAAESWLYQLQNVDPSKIASTDFDYVVMDYSRDGSEEGEYSGEEIDLIRGSGKTVLAYISIGEAEDYRFYWSEEWYENPPEWLGRENPEWPGNYAVKYWDPAWKEIVFEYVDRIMGEGFDGLYLDRIDEFEYWSDEDNGEGLVLDEEDAACRMVDLISEIRERVGDGELIVVQNGERIVSFCSGEVLDYVDGIALEDLFYMGKEKLPNDAVESRMRYTREFLNSGKLGFSVDYVYDPSDPENTSRVLDYLETAREHVLIPYAASLDRELDEIVIVEGVQP